VKTELEQLLAQRILRAPAASLEKSPRVKISFHVARRA